MGALRSSCAEFLGMSPTEYGLLRRLKEVRRVLRDADPDMVNVADVAYRFGFTQLGRFAGRYRAIFGETPSTTLRLIPGMRFAVADKIPNLVETGRVPGLGDQLDIGEDGVGFDVPEDWRR